MEPGLNEILVKLQATIIQLFFLITLANNISYRFLPYQTRAQWSSYVGPLIVIRHLEKSQLQIDRHDDKAWTGFCRCIPFLNKLKT